MSITSDDLRCDFRWKDRYGNKLRCMFDKGHTPMYGHKNGFQKSWDHSHKKGELHD